MHGGEAEAGGEEHHQQRGEEEAMWERRCGINWSGNNSEC